MDALENLITDDYAKDADVPTSGSSKPCSVRHSTCDCFYGPDEEAKLDAVLATVHKLIECLNSEMDDGQDRDLDSDPVAIATEQLTSFHHVNDRMENWFENEKTNDVVLTPKTGAGKQNSKGGDEETDKKLSFEDGEKIGKKLINEEACVKAKDNKHYFTSADLPLISASKSNNISGTEASLKRKAYATKKHTLEKDKQMTKEKIQLKFSQKLIKTLPVLEETASDDRSDYSVTKTAPQDTNETENIREDEKTKQDNAGSIKNNIDFSANLTSNQNKSDIPQLYFSDTSAIEQPNGNLTSFSAQTTSKEIFNQLYSERSKQERDFESESSSTDQDNDTIFRIKEFISRKFVRKFNKSNELEENSDVSSLDSLKEDVFDSRIRTSPSFFEKIFNMTTVAKKTTHLAKHKKLFSSFHRSQTYSGKRLSSEKYNAQELASMDSSDFAADAQMKDFRPKRERKHSKGILRSTKSEPSGFEHCPNGNFHKDFYKNPNNLDDEEECSKEKRTVVCRVGSEIKLPTLHEDGLDLDAEETFDFREGASISLSSNSSDPICNIDSSKRWKFTSEESSNLLFPNHPNMNQRASTGHLERLADQKIPKRRKFSARSFKGSQDSLDSVSKSSKFPSSSQLARLEKLADSPNDQQIMDPFSRLATKFTRTRFRNPLKSVGKPPSVTLQEPDEMAERTWIAEGDGSWSNKSGKKVELQSTNLQSLSELECEALRKLALDRLHEADIGVPIVVPKDESTSMKRKVSARKKRGLLAKDKSKDIENDHVFGIPLIDVVENDTLLRLQKSFSPSMDCPHVDSPVSEDHPSIPGRVEYSSLSSGESTSSGSSTSIHNHNDEGDSLVQEEKIGDDAMKSSATLLSSSPHRNIDHDSASDKESSSPNLASTPPLNRPKQSAASQSLRRRDAIAAHSINEIDADQSQLLEALSLSVQSETNHVQKKAKNRSMLPPTMPQVPYVVQKCCDHIKKYGLDAEGIFRIAGSKKRIKQLREEFDRGVDVTIDEDYHPHDVAALLKEFFRDLPEALMTRELFPAFLQTTKMPMEQRHDCLRYVLWLLPISNRDTLHTLLTFLSVVAAHSEIACDRHGNRVPGNKMTVYNLAAIFGPNILHRYKNSQAATESHYQGPCLEKPEDTTAVIKVVEELITNQVQLFQIPKEDHDDILHTLKEWNPTAVDYLLRRKAATQTKESPRLPRSSVCSRHSKHSGSRLFPTPDELFETKRKSGNWEPAPIISERNRSVTEAGIEKPDDSEVFVRSSTLRMSYQQATGHVTLLSDDENDIPLHHHRHQKDEGQRRISNYADQQIHNDRAKVKPSRDDITFQTKTQSELRANPEKQFTTTGKAKTPKTAFFTGDDLETVLGRTSDENLSNKSNQLGEKVYSKDPVAPKVHSFLFESQYGVASKLQGQQPAKINGSRGDGRQNGSVGSKQGCYLGPNAICDKESPSQLKSADKDEDCNNNQCLYKAICSIENHGNAHAAHSNSNHNNNNNNSKAFSHSPLRLSPRTVATINSVLSPDEGEFETHEFDGMLQATTSKPVPLPRTRLSPSDASNENVRSYGSVSEYSPRNRTVHEDLHWSSNELIRNHYDYAKREYYPSKISLKHSRSDDVRRQHNDPTLYDYHHSRSYDARRHDHVTHGFDVGTNKAAPSCEKVYAPKAARRTRFFTPTEYANDVRSQRHESSAYSCSPREYTHAPPSEPMWSSTPYNVGTTVASSRSLNDARLFSTPVTKTSHTSWYNVTGTNHLSETLV